MEGKDEQAFRELLDEHGVLRPNALAPPARTAAYTVFAQRPDAMLDIGAIKAHAARFFGAKLGLTVAKDYGLRAPEMDAARVVLLGAPTHWRAPGEDGTTSGTRLCFGRHSDPNDHAAAEAAERAQNSNGMSLLAQRCRMVWLVVRDSEHDEQDVVALTIAAILASSLLGPILSPAGDELFGVRTARMKLEGRAPPYR